MLLSGVFWGSIGGGSRGVLGSGFVGWRRGSIGGGTIGIGHGESHGGADKSQECQALNIKKGFKVPNNGFIITLISYLHVEVLIVLSGMLSPCGPPSLYSYTLRLVSVRKRTKMRHVDP